MKEDIRSSDDRKKTDSIKKEHLEYALQQEDQINSNHTYKYEQELLELIKAGDIELVKENNRNSIFPQYPQLIDYYTKKNEEYMAVITIALASRAVIQAGITSTESFQLSDVYLKKIAMASDINGILKIRNEAIETYTELVHERKRGGRAGIYVEECKQYVSANIFKKISVKDASATLNVNAIYLERIFKEAEGMTIGQYIQKEKINRAKNLLIYSDRSLMEISDYLGFSSQSHFGNVFKKEVGMTPKQFRLTNRMSGF